MCRLFKSEIGLKHILNITISTFNMATAIHLHLKGQQPHYDHVIVHIYFRFIFILLLCMYFSFTLVNDIFPYWDHLGMHHRPTASTQTPKWNSGLRFENPTHPGNNPVGSGAFLSSNTVHMLGVDHLSMNFYWRSTQSKQQSMQVLTERLHVTSHAQ